VSATIVSPPGVSRTTLAGDSGEQMARGREEKKEAAPAHLDLNKEARMI